MVVEASAFRSAVLGLCVTPAFHFGTDFWSLKIKFDTLTELEMTSYVDPESFSAVSCGLRALQFVHPLLCVDISCAGAFAQNIFSAPTQPI